MHRPSHRTRTGGCAALAGLAALALTACGGVTVSGDEDGSSGSESDASTEPGADGSPDADPIPDAQPPGQCKDGVTPLLSNAGFEQAMQPNGAIGWVEDPPPITYPDDQIPINVPEGNRAALVGKEVTLVQKLTQPVTVPDATQSLALTYLRCFVTEEEDPEVFDTVSVLLLDDGGNMLEELATYNNLDAEGCPEQAEDWPVETIQAENSYAGQALELQFLGTFDNGNQTSFYFDALALEATGPCPEGGS